LFPGYSFLISGKPEFSVPANIPVMFEIIVLSSAFAAFLGMWALNRLPRFANPLHRIDRFRRVTNDRFFLLIETADEKFNANRTRQQLEEWGATAIEDCNLDLTDQQVPNFFKMLGIVLLFLLMVPPVMIFRAYGMTNRLPRLHVVPDMDWQDKYQAQQIGPNLGTPKNPNYLYADIRAMRAPIPGTIARGDLEDDDRYFRGYEPGTFPVTDAPAVTTPASVTHGPNIDLMHQDPQPAAGNQEVPAPPAPPAPPEPTWVTQFPSQVSVTEATIQRGRQRFEIYCSACHGYAGNGDGLVNQRALALAATGQAAWTTAKSLHDPLVKPQPVGRIFDTITNGRNTMGPYRSQIPIADRWAIVLYVKALQETGIQPPAGAVPADAPNTPAANSPAVPAQ
jgi:mono/diheme cytochrome c family protein